MKKKLVVLGSTGSIGAQTLEIVSSFPESFDVVALATYSNVELLFSQVEEFKPEYVAVIKPERAAEFKKMMPSGVNLLTSNEALVELASLPEAELVVNALVGAAGLRATLAALNSGKILALANKESMVAGGPLVIDSLKRGGKILPVDSEHSALFQCLMGEEIKSVERVYITGSGGPFRGRRWSELKNVGVREALAHPRWKMGPKITIDSATLMNKGLEVIEAHFLFQIPYEKIEVVIHPESLVHGLVEFVDGSIKAQIGPTDMKLPIEFALFYPQRSERVVDRLKLSSLNLHFEPPDFDNFPCLRIALEAARLGKSYPVVLNAVNEVAVYSFLKEEILFTQIPFIIEKVVEKHIPLELSSLEVIEEVDRWSREEAKKLIKQGA